MAGGILHILSKRVAHAALALGFRLRALPKEKDMSEKTMTVSALRQQLVEKAAADGEFRSQLLADPKAAIKAEIGMTVPSEFNIEVHEDTANTSHLILPPSSQLGEADLVQVAGGFDWSQVGWR